MAQSQNCMDLMKVENSNLNQKGQLIIEYVLLLTVVTVLATAIIRLLIGQGATPGEQGLIVQKWSSIVNAISADLIDN